MINIWCFDLISHLSLPLPTFTPFLPHIFLPRYPQVTQVTEPQYGLNGIESRIRAQLKDDSRLRALLLYRLEDLLEIINNNSSSNGCETKDVKEDAETKRERERNRDKSSIFTHFLH
jgi:hypothetical protein